MIIDILVVLAGLGLLVQAVIGLGFFVSSIQEREKRASFFGGLQFLGMAALLAAFVWLALAGFFSRPLGTVVLVLLILAGGAALFLAMRRDKPNQRALDGTGGFKVGPVERFDERDVVFARVRSLRPGSKEHEAYYKMRPENLEYDEERRAKGTLGLMGSIDGPEGAFNVAMTIGCLALPHHLSQPHMWNPAKHPLAKMFVEKPATIDPAEATRRIKGYARILGADLVGVARLNPDYVYSHRGEIFNENWSDWGAPIQVEHPFVIVIAEEMEQEMIAAAPHTPTLMESMRNYAKGAFISTQIAQAIANLGFSATANHFRHYDLVLPAVAMDAGLGEMSRMGYLMTREFGPRVRLSAITTDLPLIPDKPVDLGIQSFCVECKKCATCCPSKSIPEEDDYTETNGTLRWKLNERTCYDYWAKVGTDCDVCMRVCPWSHARTWPHKLIVYLTQRNRLNQKVFTWLDDIFYGKKPKAVKPPRWAGF